MSKRLGKCPKCGGTGTSDGNGRQVDAFRCGECGKTFYVPKDDDRPTSWFGYVLAETFGFAGNLLGA